MAVQSTAGSTLGISAGIPASYNVTGYEALTFTTIGEITDLGEFGRVYNLIKHNPVGNRGTVKLKGSFDEGQMNLQLGLDYADAGQELAMEAAVSDADYSFMLTLQDGSKEYFQAKVMSFKKSPGNVDSITAASIQLELTTGPGGEGIVSDPA